MINTSWWYTIFVYTFLDFTISWFYECNPQYLSNESYREVLSQCAFYHVIQEVFNVQFSSCLSSLSNVRTLLNRTSILVVLFIRLYRIVLLKKYFRVSEWHRKVWPFKWKLLSSSFLWYCIYLSVQGCSNVKVWTFQWTLKSSTFLWYCVY